MGPFFVCETKLEKNLVFFQFACIMDFLYHKRWYLHHNLYFLHHKLSFLHYNLYNETTSMKNRLGLRDIFT